MATIDYATPGPANPLRRDLLVAGAALIWAIWWSFRVLWPFSIFLKPLPPILYQSDILVYIPVWLVLWLALWFIRSRALAVLLPVLALAITVLGSAVMGLFIFPVWGGPLDMGFVARIVVMELPRNLVGFVLCEAVVTLRLKRWRATRP